MTYKKRDSICLLLVSVSVFLFSSIGLAETLSKTEKIPLIRVDTAQKSASAIGMEIGQKSKRIFPDIEMRYDSYLSSVLTQARFNQLAEDNLPQQLAQLEPAYLEELKGIASAWALVSQSILGDGFLSLDEYHMVNLLPDLHTLTDGIAFAVVDRASSQQAPLVGRNLDMQSNPELRSLQTMTIYHDQQHSFVNIGFAGISSVLSGFNDSGLFIAYFNAESYSPYNRTEPKPFPQKSSVFAIRKALETSSSTQQAIQQLSNNPYAHNNSMLVADKRTVKILEYAVGGNKAIRDWRSRTRADKPWHRPYQIAVIDCHLSSTMKNNCKDIKDTYRWDRLQDMATFSATNPATVKNIAEILFDTENQGFRLFNQQTLQSMIYVPSNSNLYLYSQNEKGLYPNNPIHSSYLNLLTATNEQGKESSPINWLLAFVLTILVAITTWITLNTKKPLPKM